MKRHNLTRAVALSAATVLLLASPASGAPQALYGKSIVVGWQEDRQQRRADRDELMLVHRIGELRIYISEQGRPFSRLTMARVNRRGALRSGNSDAVDNLGSREDRIFKRQVDFRGRSMSVLQHRGPHGAFQILVKFDAQFQACTAQVAVGKDAPAMNVLSLISGRRVIIYSAKASGESCRIQSGNVFANE